MDRFEKVGYSLLAMCAMVYVLALVVGMLAAMPYGLIGFVLFVGLGTLVMKVLKERLGNKEDDYYVREVTK